MEILESVGVGPQKPGDHRNAYLDLVYQNPSKLQSNRQYTLQERLLSSTADDLQVVEAGHG